MTAYTDATKIAAHLGVTLTAPQIVQAGVVAQAISDWIDRQTNQSWQATSPVTDELHTLAGNGVYLTHRPAVAVSSVKTRAAIYVGQGWTTLDASQYELLDAANGVLLIAGWSASSEGLVQVSYTHTSTVAPSDVALAATILAADLMSTTLNPESAAVGSISAISVGQNDINVKYAEGATTSPASRAVTSALDMIRSRRMPVIA